MEFGIGGQQDGADAALDQQIHQTLRRTFGINERKVGGQKQHDPEQVLDPAGQGHGINA
jgi:hypothetical protein